MEHIASVHAAFLTARFTTPKAHFILQKWFYEVIFVDVRMRPNSSSQLCCTGCWQDEVEVIMDLKSPKTRLRNDLAAIRVYPKSWKFKIYSPQSRWSPSEWDPTRHWVTEIQQVLRWNSTWHKYWQSKVEMSNRFNGWNFVFKVLGLKFCYTKRVSRGSTILIVEGCLCKPKCCKNYLWDSGQYNIFRRSQLRECKTNWFVTTKWGTHPQFRANDPTSNNPSNHPGAESSSAL